MAKSKDDFFTLDLLEGTPSSKPPVAATEKKALFKISQWQLNSPVNRCQFCLDSCSGLCKTGQFGNLV
jgi:hypothetical protein